MSTNGDVRTDVNGQLPDVSQGPDLWGIVWRRKWVVILLMLVGLALGGLYYAKTPRVYQSQARILVTQTRPIPIETQPWATGRDAGMGNMLETQALLITSPLVIAPAISGQWVEEQASGVDELLRKIEQETGKGVDGTPPEPEPAPPEDLRSLPSLVNTANPMAVVINNLEVEREEETAVLTLSYRSSEQADCQAILKAVVASYQRYLKGTRDNVTKDALDLITRAKDDLARDVDKMEKEYLEFRRNNAHLLFKVSEEHNIYEARQATIEQERSRILLERSQAVSQLEAMQDALKRGADRDALRLLIKESDQLDNNPLETRLEQIEKRISEADAELAQTDRNIARTEQKIQRIDDQRREVEQAAMAVDKAAALVQQLQQSIHYTTEKLRVLDQLEQQLDDPKANRTAINAELLRLVQQERELTDRYGPDHPDVVSVRQFIELSRSVLESAKTEEQRQRLASKREDLEDRLMQLQGQLMVADVDYDSLKKQQEMLLADLTDWQAEREALTKQLDELQQQYDRLADQAKALRRGRDELEDQLVQLGIHAPLDGGPAAEAAKKTNDEAVSKLFKVYLESLQEQIAAMDRRLEHLDEMFNAEQQKAKDLEQLEAADQTYQSALARKQRLFDVVLNRLEELNITDDLGGYDATVVSSPSFGRQVEPNLPKSLAVGLVLGMLAGFGLAYVIDLADKRFRTPDDIRRDLGLPLLGHIPIMHTENANGDSKLDSALYVFHKPRSRISECYRSVRTSLYFSQRGQQLKVIQVTSPAPGDGKTTLAANLALSIAQSGKRVLLLDADFRRPRIHKLFGVSRDKGLSNVIDDGESLRDNIQRTGVDNLYLMACGHKVRNPAELLSSVRFQEVLDQLRSNRKLDYIIIDTPPVLFVTDPSNVAPRVDGVLLVLRLTKRTRPAAIRATENLASLGVPLLGVVVNAIGDGRKGYGYGYAYGYTNYDYHYSYPRYSYGYGYGYGYGRYGYRYGDAVYGDDEEESSSDGNGQAGSSKQQQKEQS